MESQYPDPQARQHSIRQAIVRQSIVEILKFIGEDPDREGLLETPDRLIKAWKEIFRGYDLSAEDILSKRFEQIGGYDGIVLSKDIPFVSFCEHHCMVFSGKAHVAYIVGDYAVGLSKLARLVDMHACRLQVQERMTADIANDLERVLQPKGVGVVIESEHHCMSCRGVKKTGSTMVTSCMKGFFMDDVDARRELLALIQTP